MAGKTQSVLKRSHEVTEKRGGVFKASSASEIPKTNQAYRISKIARKPSDDSLKQVIKNKHQDDRNGNSIIQKMQSNSFSYDVVVFNDRIVKNIANFCCTNGINLKSAFCFDFTFDLGNNPLNYVLLFQNISLIKKTTKKSQAISGPILICHKRHENSVKLLCDTILDNCPELSLNLKVIC